MEAFVLAENVQHTKRGTEDNWIKGRQMFLILKWGEYDAQSFDKAWEVVYPYRENGFGTRKEAEDAVLVLRKLYGLSKNMGLLNITKICLTCV